MRPAAGGEWADSERSTRAGGTQALHRLAARAPHRGDTTTARERDGRLFDANVGKSYAYGFLMDLSLAAPIWVLYLRDERGFSLSRITLLEVPLFLLIVLAEVPTGTVADRFGRKVSLMLASGVLALSVFVYGVATSYLTILVSNLAWGLAFAFRSGADTALLYDSLREAGREDEFQGINGRLWALRSLAVLAGFLLGAPIAGATSYSFAIVLSAGIAACAFPVALAMHEPRPARETAPEPYLRFLVSGLRDAWQAPSLRYIFSYSGLVGAGAAAPVLLYQQPWLTEHGIGTASLGLWQAPVQGAEVLAALAAAWLLSRLGERAAFGALPLVLFLCGAALGASDGLWVAGAFLGVAAVRGLHHPLLAGYVNRRIASERRATVLSVQSVAGNAVMAVSWPLGGAAADAFGLRTVFLAYACGTLLLAGVALLLWDRAERPLSERRS
jgi:MFS family permease